MFKWAVLSAILAFLTPRTQLYCRGLRNNVLFGPDLCGDEDYDDDDDDDDDDQSVNQVQVPFSMSYVRDNFSLHVHNVK